MDFQVDFFFLGLNLFRWQVGHNVTHNTIQLPAGSGAHGI